MSDDVRLVLLRHGEAERTAPRDELRALTLAGREEAHRAGHVLAALRAAPVAVCSSPYLRARETATLVAAALGCAETAVIAGITPDDDPRRALAAIDARLVPGTLLVVVSHMPLLGSLAGLLVHGDARQGPGLATGSGLLLAGEVFAPGLLRRERDIDPRAAG